ncbi:MAG: transcription-repair coupling factor [Deltaproteobacteria bacterium]
MSNLSNLISSYSRSDQIKKLNSLLDSTGKGRIFLSGMNADMPYFILATLIKSNDDPILVIAEDKEEAAYIYNTFQNISENAVFFPDSFKRPNAFEELNNNNIKERTELVYKIHDSASLKIVVTYPEAIFEKVLRPESIDLQKIEIKKNENLDLDTMISFLVEYDFARTDYVYEPGQFSIRGGIIDIFNYSSDWPYRIELFDDEVESIRYFDPTTQLSVNELGKITLIPNVNSRFGSNDKCSLLEVMRSNWIICIRDFENLLDRLQQSFEKLKEFEKTVLTTDENILRMVRQMSFVYPKDMIMQISAFRNIMINSVPDDSLSKTIVFSSQPQPSFNKNFEMLIRDLRRNTESGYENYIFASNSRQIERFYQIFEDLEAKVDFHPIPTSIKEGFIDNDLKIACYTDHQIFQRFYRYNLQKGFSSDKAASLRMLRELAVGDYVTHIDHGIGKYTGLEIIEVNGHKQESMRLVYKNNDVLYVSINAMHKVNKYIGKEGAEPVLDKLGSDRWKKLKFNTKRKIKDIARELIALYAKRRASKGFTFSSDDYLQIELEASFIYEDTPDQEKATIAVKKDMESEYPMDRLICGDVGFGKTEVAIRAAFKAVLSGKQVAVLVPTTILALQHYKTFCERLKDFPVSVDYLNRFKSQKEKTEIYKKIKDGHLNIIIGTHALLNKSIEFKDLGLLILDEEQKFGVTAKEKLRQIKVNVDTLTLTATPIPRTLQFSLMGSRDMSVINTPPPNRQPIHTERRVFSNDLLVEAINYELDRGGQVFFIHNRIKDLPDVTNVIKKLVPAARVAMAHGQMESDQLETTLLEFIDGKKDILVSTNIIETGLDIPNANTMFINNAQNFGLSDLHQLRGRIGRSNIKAFCYMITPDLSVLSSDAKKKIRTIEEFSDLGSGFNIAMRDLDIRGAGNLLGAEQSGFIADIGYETYMKILEEAIRELKSSEFTDVYKEEESLQKEHVRDVEVDMDLEMLIPDEYVSNIHDRLILYKELGEIDDEAGIKVFTDKLRDRFGKIPWQVGNLFEGLKIKWICRKLGFERFSLKANVLRLFFISQGDSLFYNSEIFNRILNTLSSPEYSSEYTLKQTPKHLLLIKTNIRSLREAREILEKLHEKVM